MRVLPDFFAVPQWGFPVNGSGSAADAEQVDGVNSRKLVQMCALVCGCVAVVVCASWWLGAPQTLAFGANYVPMAPSTAMLFILLSASLFVSARWPSTLHCQAFSLTCLNIVFLVSLVLAGAALAGFDSPLEHFSAKSSYTPNGIQLGRMSLHTAIAFMLTSTALFCRSPRVHSQPIFLYVSLALSWTLFLISEITITGYIAGIPPLLEISKVPMALLTAVSFLLLSVSLLLPAIRQVRLMLMGPGVGSTQNIWRCLAVAMLCILVAAILRAAIVGSLGRAQPFVTFYPAVMIAALYGGLAGGLFATILSGILSQAWIQNGILSGPEWLGMAVFLACCTLIASIGEALKHAAALLRSSGRFLESAVAQRTLDLDQKNVALQRALVTLADVERIARHDLKTPLASLAAAPAMLRALRPASAREETILGMIENAANQALSMVNLSLDLYRMESGTYQLHPVAVDLSALVNTVAQQLGVHAQSKSVELAVTGAEQPVWALGEASLCYSIIANIAKNAIEAAPDRSTVQMTLHATPEVRLVIHNSGAVPLDMRDRFFEKYASSGKAQGTGLGTYSSQLLSRAQGGTLTMETSDTLGTTLTLTLRPSAPALQRDVPQPDLARTRDSTQTPVRQDLQVLLVDDDDFSCLVMESNLTRPQVAIDIAVNGRLAVEAVMRKRPDIIFLDIEMPVMDGSTALVKIREYQASVQQAPSLIVAVTGHDDVSSQAHYRGIGFDRVLTKPCSRDEIGNFLRSTMA